MSKSKRQRATSAITQPVRKVIGVTDSLSRDFVGTVDRAAKSTEMATLIALLEDRVSEFRRERKLGKGTLRSTYIEAFRGYVSHGEIRLRMRVMEEPVIPVEAEALADTQILRANLRRFVALAFPGLNVKVTANGMSVIGTSDRHGFVTLRIPTKRIASGWHEYRAELIDDENSQDVAIGQFFVPNANCKTVIVSDIDDTILKTGLSEGLTAIGRTLLRNAQTRSPIEGMAELYQDLVVETIGGRELVRPLAYLSTGGWVLYDMLTEFMKYQNFPDGVLFLTDWGPQQRFVMRSGKEHKLQALRRILDEDIDFRAILIGDSGQKDPYTYTQIAMEYPGRVAAIIILNAGDHLHEKSAELEAATPGWRKQGIPFHFVNDSKEARVVLVALGLIDSSRLSKRELDAVKAEAKVPTVSKKAKTKATPKKRAQAKKPSSKGSKK